MDVQPHPWCCLQSVLQFFFFCNMNRLIIFYSFEFCFCFCIKMFSSIYLSPLIFYYKQAKRNPATPSIVCLEISSAFQVALVIKNLPANAGDKRHRFDPWVRKIPWRTALQPTPVFLPGESHGQKSLVGYSPRGCQESDTTKQLHFHFYFHYFWMVRLFCIYNDL